MWMSKLRVYRALNKLEEEKLLSRYQERGAGKFGKTIYRITTKHIGIWNGVDQFFLEETDDKANRMPESPHAVKPEHGLPEHGKPESEITAHLSIDNKEVVDNIEVIGEREVTRAREEEKTETYKQPADLPKPSANQPALELDYQPAFDFLFAYLKTNPEICRTRVERARFGGASITSREALEGYLNKLNREKRFFDLTIPQDDGKQFQWIAGHLAGWESYMRSWKSNEDKRQSKYQKETSPIKIKSIRTSLVRQRNEREEENRLRDLARQKRV